MDEEQPIIGAVPGEEGAPHRFRRLAQQSANPIGSASTRPLSDTSCPTWAIGKLARVPGYRRDEGLTSEPGSGSQLITLTVERAGLDADDEIYELFGD